MSIECSECERDARGGHAEDCSRYVVDLDRYVMPEDQAFDDAAANAQEGGPYVLPKLRSQEELESLKAEWISDPHWDLETTEGFESYHDQLVEFAREMRTRWAIEQQAFERGRTESLQAADPNHWLKEIATELKTLNANIVELGNTIAASSGRF